MRVSVRRSRQVVDDSKQKITGHGELNTGGRRRVDGQEERKEVRARCFGGTEPCKQSFKSLTKDARGCAHCPKRKLHMVSQKFTRGSLNRQV